MRFVRQYYFIRSYGVVLRQCVDASARKSLASSRTDGIGKFREKIVPPEAFTAELKRHLMGQISREKARGEILKVDRQHLDEKDVSVLIEAFGSGFRSNHRGQKQDNVNSKSENPDEESGREHIRAALPAFASFRYWRYWPPEFSQLQKQLSLSIVQIVR